MERLLLMVILILAVCLLAIVCGTSSESLFSPFESSKAVGYDIDKLKLITENSVLGIGCGNPTRFAGINEGNIVVD